MGTSVKNIFFFQKFLFDFKNSLKNMDVSIEYISAACNQVPHTVALNKNDTSLIYGACNSIIQVEIKNDRMVAKKAFIGHTDRVNCVRWTGNQSFVTGGTDKKSLSLGKL